jgi:hypothetical protein
MSQYFASNSLAGFFRSSTAIFEATTAGRFDSAYVSSYIAMNSVTSGYITSATFAASGTVWTRFSMYTPSAASASGSGGCFQLNNGLTGVFRLTAPGSWGATTGTYTPQYWNGSAWTATGSAFTVPVSALNVLTVKVVLNTSYEIYLGGTLVASGSGWSGGPTSATNIQLFSQTGQSVHGYSEVMVASYDLRDSHLMLAALNGNSAANTGGAGSYTDINETPINEATAESISVSGNKMGQTKASITVPAGYDIKGMVIAARGRVSGTITDGKFGIRSASTNYSSSALTLAAAYEPRVYISALDPATGTDFTQSGFNSAETYFEAV